MSLQQAGAKKKKCLYGVKKKLASSRIKVILFLHCASLLRTNYCVIRARSQEFITGALFLPIFLARVVQFAIYSDIYIENYRKFKVRNINFSLTNLSFIYFLDYHKPQLNVLFLCSYSDCCWISLANGGSSWFLSTTVNLTRQQNNGKINSSPISALSPIVRIQQGCPRIISIPAEDSDGDKVRCRWSTGQYRECGGVCHVFNSGTLDEVS